MVNNISRLNKFTKIGVALIGSIGLLAACSSTKHLASTKSPKQTLITSKSLPKSGSSSTSSTINTTGSSFPSIVSQALATLSKLNISLYAPKKVPLPSADAKLFLGATLSSTPTSYVLNFSMTPTQLPFNAQPLSSPPYLPGDPNYLGSFSVSKISPSSAVTSQIQTLANDLDSTCRSQLTPSAITSSVAGQSCANGTGTTILWSEGNWRLGVIASNSLGPADVGLANEIATYLNSNFLPPPNGLGVIKASAQGGTNALNPSSTIPITPATSVEITYVLNGELFQINDALDALGGLEMAVSTAPF